MSSAAKTCSQCRGACSTDSREVAGVGVVCDGCIHDPIVDALAERAECAALARHFENEQRALARTARKRARHVLAERHEQIAKLFGELVFRIEDRARSFGPPPYRGNPETRAVRKQSARAGVVPAWTPPEEDT